LNAPALETRAEIIITVGGNNNATPSRQRGFGGGVPNASLIVAAFQKITYFQAYFSLNFCSKTRF